MTSPTRLSLATSTNEDSDSFIAYAAAIMISTSYTS
jgi:hypothetical protein